ncbi:PAS domain-containing protein [Isoptericola sp. b490]|uniref:PAS domain-containing protein n=1 Tax=Actinotalea lenta TaxID=3064654 RepID=UPI002712BE49|nr:PAS domain-containing protein [Isoptericola sp. b490]MDO8119729.1 PAS domain-containing protein [Isoptericola sp. b490]
MDSNDAHRRVLASLRDGLYVTDRNRVITFWNAAAHQITGYPSDKAIGRWCGDGFLDHVDDDDVALCGSRCPLLASMSDGQTRTVAVSLKHRDGHRVRVQVTASPLHDHTGHVIGAVETFHPAPRAGGQD